MVETAGLARNPELRLLAPDLSLQPVDVIATRLLCMAVVAAHAFGFSLAETNRWLDSENLRGSLSLRERAFLFGASEHLMSCQMQVQGVYALAWVVSAVDTFSANDKMPDDLVHHLPDFRKQESSRLFRSRLDLRPAAEVMTQLDDAYCFLGLERGFSIQQSQQCTWSPSAAKPWSGHSKTATGTMSR